jgi:hypothetical protein
MVFVTLSEMTPADRLLVDLSRRDWAAGVKSLGSQLALLRCQFEEIAALEEDLGTETEGAPEDAKDSVGRAFGQTHDALLEQAGGAYSLTEAAKMLRISRQAMHKRIAGGTALGMMGEGNEIIVPRLQFTVGDDKPKVLFGIDAVTKQFNEAAAGPWMALQYLIDSDPNLGRSPIEALQAGEREAVVQAARAYLHLDEE